MSVVVLGRVVLNRGLSGGSIGLVVGQLFVARQRDVRRGFEELFPELSSRCELGLAGVVLWVTRLGAYLRCVPNGARMLAILLD